MRARSTTSGYFFCPCTLYAFDVSYDVWRLFLRDLLVAAEAAPTSAIGELLKLF
ncbi:MAG: hypothetical protein COB30_003145 [Ectothiorhodospiraceae bacterium]|nr:hypothetical protein [Ectothiorhodospiraceae bacterium]